jgi:hypothetical protein
MCICEMVERTASMCLPKLRMSYAALFPSCFPASNPDRNTTSAPPDMSRPEAGTPSAPPSTPYAEPEPTADTTEAAETALLAPIGPGPFCPKM